MKLNKAIISAVTKSVEYAKAKNEAVVEKVAKFVDEKYSIQSFHDFLSDCGSAVSKPLSLEEARVTSVKSVNPTTYDRYAPVYGLHAE